MLVLAPLVVAGVGLFLKSTRFGMAIRASASNPEAARMAGISTSRMSSLAWGLAAAMAALAAILTQPTQVSGADSFGPSLLLIALAGAVLARMRSLPIALAAGAAIGVLEQLVLWNYARAGLVQLVLFVVIVASLLVQKVSVGRSEARGSWSAVEVARPLPAAIRRVPAVRALGPVVGVVGLAVCLVLPQLVSNATATQLTGSIGFVVMGVSVGVITGLGGQLSLGQFAIGAIGAFVSFEVSRRTGSFPLAFFYAGVASAALSALIGLPAVRARGLLLTVTTLSFALVVPSYLLEQTWLFGPGVDPGRPKVGDLTFGSGRSYYYVGLGVLVLVMLLAHNIRSTGIGRRLVGVRDNEDAARAFSIPASMVKVQGLLLSGFIAGLGGAMYGHSLSFLGASAFPTKASIDVVVVAVIGGLGMLTGPLLGALVVQGTTYLSLDAAALAATAFGQLLILMYLPGGLGSVALRIRDAVALPLARRAGVDVEAAYAAEHGFDEDESGPDREAPTSLRTRRRPPHAAGPILEARGLDRRFGGVHAVRGVDLVVEAGETVGLIGTNGAGKTTTFELLSGFVTLDGGSVRYDGDDVTHLGPEERGRRGLIRSFQDAALFPTLTVQESVQLALERIAPTKLVPALLGSRRQDRRKAARAAELIAWLGLSRYRGSQVRELSTGTRRLVEIACLVALEPTVLLLDEPSSGVAQSETEALGALLAKLKTDLDLTLVIIEHDIPLVMALADRIVCLADGTVIAEGTPDEVRNDPLVIESYLGGSRTAIERSTAGAAR
jgi:ABC-type branched-subunit amino acid transport system ATPase component/ABC-type branched-subunit amino acid transport system permease subunit